MPAIDMCSENTECTILMTSASMRHKLAPRLHVLRLQANLPLISKSKFQQPSDGLVSSSALLASPLALWPTKNTKSLNKVPLSTYRYTREIIL